MVFNLTQMQSSEHRAVQTQQTVHQSLAFQVDF